jgi:Cu+-exporting ATPase
MSSAVQLDIEGMTCASCATRVEKALNSLEGVEASVNYATERATIVVGGADSAELLRAVEGAGYRASVHTEDSVSPEEAPDRLRTRLIVSAAITIPVVVLSMVPLFQFPYWQWVVSALAVPVATWGAWPFHRAAAINARHGVATMDTLISLGVLAAVGWSCATPYLNFFTFHFGVVNLCFATVNTHFGKTEKCSRSTEIRRVFFEKVCQIVAGLRFGGAK